MSQLQADEAQSDAPLRLLLRPSCVLCLEAEYVLSQAGITVFERVDIERRDGFEECYGTRIPVLAQTGGPELDWPFDAPAVLRFLAGST